MRQVEPTRQADERREDHVARHAGRAQDRAKANQPADAEHRQKREREEHRRVEAYRSAPERDDQGGEDLQAGCNQPFQKALKTPFSL